MIVEQAATEGRLARFEEGQPALHALDLAGPHGEKVPFARLTTKAIAEPPLTNQAKGTAAAIVIAPVFHSPLNLRGVRYGPLAQNASQ